MIVTKRAWYWYKNRYTDQWNRIKNPEIKANTYSQLTFDKTNKNTEWGKKHPIQQMVLYNRQVTCRRMSLDPHFFPYTKINSWWTEDLNIRPETKKILEGNIGKALVDTGLGKDFMTQNSKANATKTRINRWDLIKLKSFCTAKETISKQTTHGVEENLHNLYIQQSTNIQNLQGTQTN